MKRPPSITIAEYLTELERLQRGDPDAMTTREIADRLGIGVAKVRDLLHVAQRENRLQRAPKVIETLSGTFRRTVAFKILPPK